jgi:predicted amidophosphoribosyltransferase
MTGRQGEHRAMDEKNVAPNIVYCNRCGMGNPSINKFCYECGNSLLSATCSYCSQANPHYAKFCSSCGRKLKTKE